MPALALPSIGALPVRFGLLRTRKSANEESPRQNPTARMEFNPMQTDAPKIERGTGNIFADLGHPNAETHLLKAQLVTRIEKIIRQHKLQLPDAAAILALSQPALSRLLHGHFREHSVEHLLRLLTALDRTAAKYPDLPSMDEVRCSSRPFVKPCRGTPCGRPRTDAKFGPHPSEPSVDKERCSSRSFASLRG